jgi:hypothetical protein
MATLCARASSSSCMLQIAQQRVSAITYPAEPWPGCKAAHCLCQPTAAWTLGNKTETGQLPKHSRPCRPLPADTPPPLPDSPHTSPAVTHRHPICYHALCGSLRLAHQSCRYRHILQAGRPCHWQAALHQGLPAAGQGIPVHRPPESHPRLQEQGCHLVPVSVHVGAAVGRSQLQ